MSPGLAAPFHSRVQRPPQHLLPHHQDRFRAGVITGVLAAAATAGVSIGIGWVEGYSPFAAAGRQLFATFAPSAIPSAVAATVTGITLHTVIALFWGLVFASIASQLAGLRLVVVAILSSAVIWALNVWLAASLLRFGNDLTAFPTQAALFYVVLAVALAYGIALARESR